MGVKCTTMSLNIIHHHPHFVCVFLSKRVMGQNLHVVGVDLRALQWICGGKI